MQMKVTFKLMTLAFLLPFSFNLHSAIPPEPPQMPELKKAWKQAKELYRNQPWIVIEQWDTGSTSGTKKGYYYDDKPFDTYHKSW